jgi:hypothetical protein
MPHAPITIQLSAEHIEAGLMELWGSSGFERCEPRLDAIVVADIIRAVGAKAGIVLQIPPDRELSAQMSHVTP